MYPTYFAVLLAFFVASQGVTAVPLRVGFEQATQERKDMINDANVEANRRLTNMQTVISQPNAHQDPRVIAAFGPNANVAGITDGINAIAGGKIVVGSTDIPDVQRPDGTKTPYMGAGATDMSQTPPRVAFGTAFYTSGNDKGMQAGTIIHEASHALAGTKDHYKNGHPVSENTPGAQNSYKDSPHYDSIKAGSTEMHMNADSYRHFSDLCARHFLKRALFEEDPAQRRELHRRAAVCAYRPRPKHSVTPAQGTVGAVNGKIPADKSTLKAATASGGIPAKGVTGKTGTRPATSTKGNALAGNSKSKPGVAGKPPLTKAKGAVTKRPTTATGKTLHRPATGARGKAKASTPRIKRPAASKPKANTSASKKAASPSVKRVTTKAAPKAAAKGGKKK